MKPIRGLLLFAVFALAFIPLRSSARQAETNLPYAQMHIQHEQSVWNALKAKNQNSLQSLFGYDALFITPQGVKSVSEFRSSLSSLNLTNFSLSDFSVREPGPDSAVVTYKVSQSGTYEGKALPSTAYVSSVWGKHAENWRLVVRQITPTQ